MSNFIDAVYEIEFKSLFVNKGHALTQIKYLSNELRKHTSMRDKLVARGAYATQETHAVTRITRKLNRYKKEIQAIDDYKDEIASGNPMNTDRAEMGRIIRAAYERAYAENQR